MDAIVMRNELTLGFWSELPKDLGNYDMLSREGSCTFGFIGSGAGFEKKICIGKVFVEGPMMFSEWDM